MPDSAMLHLLQQLNMQPPAIVQPAAGMDGGPYSYAYDHMMAEKSRVFETWLAKAPAMRAMLLKAVKTRPEGFTVAMLTAAIEPFERNISEQARITSRLWKAHKRRPLIDPLQRRVQEWLFECQRRHYEAAEDLILFLRAVRAEIDPESRGGPTFDTPKDLERYLMDDAA